VAGWISTRLGSIPPAGKKVDLDGLAVEILSADRRRIHRVRVKRPPAPPEPDSPSS